MKNYKEIPEEGSGEFDNGVVPRSRPRPVLNSSSSEGSELGSDGHAMDGVFSPSDAGARIFFQLREEGFRRHRVLLPALFSLRDFLFIFKCLLAGFGELQRVCTLEVAVGLADSVELCAGVMV